MKRFFFIALVIVIFDQLTKLFMQDIHYGIFNYVTNTGAAFSLFTGYVNALAIFSLFAIIFIIYLYKLYPSYEIPLSFILGGAIGNLIDRTFLGFVRDFIDLKIWPIFNLADSFNVIGTLMVIYLIWKNYAQNIKADLIVLCVLVENIERNKVAYRESINPFTKEPSFIPKPYFDYKNGELLLKNFPTPRAKDNISSIEEDMIQWAIPKKQEFIYNFINILRQSKIFNPIRKKFDNILKKFRSFLISNFYQPYPDYKKHDSKGNLLMNKILSKFIDSLPSIPVIILPIPTYHYYVDGAKPIYKSFFQNFESRKIYPSR